MKRILLLSMVFSFVFAFNSMAQRTVSGKVTDDTGDGLPGVNVVLKGTTTGVTTDLDGNYQISIPDDNTVLVYSSVGMRTQEVSVGARSTIDLGMALDTTTLEEVVVTALGISKEKASLGYGVSTVGSDQLAGRQEADIARILRGKATGVAINSTSGLAGSGTNIVIRGYTTITGSNQPLFVVDGIPFNTDTNTGNQNFVSGSATASSRFLDLDPNNIASVDILKGLSATVLYGESGRNGVILVTTKNGQGGAGATEKTEISITQGVYQTQIANVPDYQNTYGNGFSASFGWFFSNWGAAFADQNPESYGFIEGVSDGDYLGINSNNRVLITHPLDQQSATKPYNEAFPEYIGKPYAYKPYRSVEKFFQKGSSSITSVSVQSRLSDNASVSASYSYLSEEGFTPELDAQRGSGRSNFIDKHNFGLGAQTTLNNGLKISGVFNYVTIDRLTPITAPAFGGDGNGLFAAILFTPRSMDLIGLPYQSPVDGSNVYYRRGGPIQNPRWTLNNSGQTEDLNRFYSATNFSYDITDNITALYRLSLDKYTQVNERYINKGGSQVPDGELGTQNINSSVIDHVLNVLYNFDLTEELSIDGVVGVNTRDEVRSEYGISSTEQFVFNLQTHQNYISSEGYSFLREETTVGVYGTVSLGYRHYLYLNLQARNDWTSTLEEENRAVLYPSINVAFVPTDAFPTIQSSVLNYVKLRVGYGTSAGYPNPYSTRSILNSSTADFVSPGGTILNTNSVSDELGNRNLTRELVKEYEAGLEAKFWNNRIGIDFSVYNKKSEDLIISLPLDPSTGFQRTTVNAAEVVNKGVELGLTTNIPLPGGITWNSTVNYTKIVNNVKSIIDGIDRVQIAGYSNLGNYAIPQNPFGVMLGEPFDRDDQGRLIVDNEGEYRSSGALEVIGDPNPDYTMNWINGFSWKGVSFGFHWQYIKGGDMYSSTVQTLLARGNTTDTDVDRNIPIILPNSVKDSGTEDGDGNTVYVENDIQTYIGDSFFSAYLTQEGGIFDATVIRLRQVSIGYVLPKSLLENTPFGTVGITISGENLFYNAPNFPEGINFDPEISSIGVGNGRGFDFRTAPTAKKYGATLNLTF